MTAARAKIARRRTQTERSDAMRQRLLVATLQSLAEDGYAGTTLNSVVRRAGVSRGAQVHHYPNKQALILDAASDLVHRTYRTLGEVILGISDEDNRLQALVMACWKQLFDTPLYRAYAELVAASQHDAPLAEALRQLSQRARAVFEPAVNHYFEPVPGATEDLNALFSQVSCLMIGLSAQAHLIEDSAYVKTLLDLWIRQTLPAMRAKKRVTTPPPRPKSL